MALQNLFNLAKGTVAAKINAVTPSATLFKNPVSPALQSNLSSVTPSVSTSSPFNLTKLSPIPNLQMGISSVQNNQKRIQELKVKAQSQGLTKAEADEYARLTGQSIKTQGQAEP